MSIGDSERSQDAEFFTEEQSLPSGAYESDWQVNSILLLAQRTLTQLNDGASERQTATEQVLSSLIHQFMAAVQAYYLRGIDLLYSRPHDSNDPIHPTGGLRPEKDPYTHRQIVERIGDEWAQIMGFVGTAHLFALEPASIRVQRGESEPDRLFTILRKVVEQAQQDLNFAPLSPVNGDSWRFMVLPHFGRSFELVHFKYAPDITVIGVPFTSLYCPWEWTLIWHEVAGIYVERGRKLAGGIIGAVTTTLQQQLIDGNPAIWQNWRNRYDEELANLDGNNPSQELISNWAEELVEDAFGVLCLGPSMAENLDYILRRHYATRDDSGGGVGTVLPIRSDDRHPPGQFRVAVAQELCTLMKVPVSNQNLSDPVANAVATTIMHHRTTLSTRVFNTQDEQLCERLIHSIAGGSKSGQPQAPGTLNEAIDRLITSTAHNTTIRPQHIIAAVTRAFRSNIADGSLLRVNFAGPPKMQIDQTTAIIPDQLGDLLDHAFSIRDQGTVTPLSHTKHTGPQQGLFQISGIIIDGQKHNFLVKVYHFHDRGNLKTQKDPGITALTSDLARITPQ